MHDHASSCVVLIQLRKRLPQEGDIGTRVFLQDRGDVNLRPYI